MVTLSGRIDERAFTGAFIEAANAPSLELDFFNASVAREATSVLWAAPDVARDRGTPVEVVRLRGHTAGESFEPFLRACTDLRVLEVDAGTVTDLDAVFRAVAGAPLKVLHLNEPTVSAARELGRHVFHVETVVHVNAKPNPDILLALARSTFDLVGGQIHWPALGGATKRPRLFCSYFDDPVVQRWVKDTAGP